MILSQEQYLLKAQVVLNRIFAMLQEAAASKKRIDLVEREIFAEALKIGLMAMRAFVSAQGDGDQGKTVEHNHKTLQRLPKAEKRYVSIFGELFVNRYVYAERQGQKIEWAPVDESLGLPAEDFSSVLEDWLQRFCVNNSFDESVKSLTDMLGVAPSQRAAETMNRRVAEDAGIFQASQEAPPKEEEGELLVVTADGKGVPMRRPVEERVHRSQPRRGKGEKANKKQMASVGAVYTIDRFVRQPQEIVDEVLRHERAQDRPTPQHKQVWAELTETDPDTGVEYNGREKLFAHLTRAADARDRNREMQLVCLFDGEAALWREQESWMKRGVGILDLFHVLERLWQVAYCFHPERSAAATSFVSHHLTMLLEGKVGYVIGNFRRLLKQHRLIGNKRKTLQAVITYYENNRDQMKYDEYLAAGYPIGSGVAEGACRHLVKDRMERTGMRWTVEGAQSMLRLRSIHINGQWPQYIEHHIQAEQARLYRQAA